MKIWILNGKVNICPKQMNLELIVKMKYTRTICDNGWESQKPMSQNDYNLTVAFDTL